MQFSNTNHTRQGAASILHAPLLLLIVLALWPLHSAHAQTGYSLPSKAMIDLVDGAVSPSVSISPDREWMLILERPGLPDIAEVASEELRLAGFRLNPATNGPSRSSHLTGVTIQEISSGKTTPLRGLPAQPRLSSFSWSPDGTSFAFLHTTSDDVELWIADLRKAEARKLSDGVNATYGGVFEWEPDSRSLLVKRVPLKRGTPPVAPSVPPGPVIEESSGRVSPARTYQDLLQNPHDEALFEYYVRSELVRIPLSGKVDVVLSSALHTSMEISPDGAYLLVETLERPYSYQLPASRFPSVIRVYDRKGRPVHDVAQLPLADQVPTGFSSVRTGPRSVEWRADQPATLLWVEAQDGGDGNATAEVRDRIFTLKAPFQDEPEVLIDLGYRFSGAQWSEEGFALVSEYWWSSRHRRTWMVGGGDPEPRLVFDLSTEDRYSDPGQPVLKQGSRGRWVLHTTRDGKGIYLRGDGASPQGNRPFLAEFDLQGRTSDVVWRSSEPFYESISAVHPSRAGVVILQREGPTTPPNYYLLTLGSGEEKPLTSFAHPTPELKEITKELITYPRTDGVQLSATLYLPAGYDPKRDGPLPTLVWAYPREFKSATAASQVTDSPYRFTRISYWGPQFMLLEGFAVVEGAAMPIVGEENEQPNDTFVDQLVSSAQAVIDELVRRGVTDPSRVAIGGHSYGAFMTANLLAHSDLFRAGIARSGAYNRTLTPFGFQAEPRTFWEAPDVYFAMSPFMNAEKIDEPMLMIHGAADNNSGTFPIQSERMYAALSGLGGTARLVMLPHESHGYQARQSILHMLHEQTQWLNRYVRNAMPRDLEKQEPQEGPQR